MAEKTIKTKIKLRQETYAYWTDTTATAPATKTAGAGTNGYYVPLFGEVCFCEITATNQGTQTTPPTVLFKVGNGKDYFKDLNWASALAADVFSWAKCQYVALNGTTLEFYNQPGDASTKSVKHQVDLSKFALASSIGTLTDLSTTKKGNLVEAINEVLQAVNVGGTGSVVSITKEATPTTGSHSSYTFKQGETTLTPKIEIPEVTVSKLTTPTSGSQATYQIKQGGTAATTKIEIPTAPSITITDDTAVETPTTDTVAVYKNLTANGHTLTEELVSVPTKKYVDDEIAAKVAGAVQYLGTVSAASNLGKNESGTTITIGKGDFYRASAAFDLGSEKVHVGDMLIAIVDNPGTTTTNWDVAHLEIDTNTWTENSDTAAGYVAATGGTTNAGKVWKVGSDGKPAWLADTDTHHQAKNIVGTSATATANGAVTGTGGVYLNLVENGVVRSTHNIVGSGAATVKSDANGKITINATNTWNALSASQDGYVSKDWYTKLNTIATKYAVPDITGEVVLAEQTDITYILDCN